MLRRSILLITFINGVDIFDYIIAILILFDKNLSKLLIIHASVNPNVKVSKDLFLIVWIILSKLSNWVVYNSTYPGKSTNINVFSISFKKSYNYYRYYSAKML